VIVMDALLGRLDLDIPRAREPSAHPALRAGRSLSHGAALSDRLLGGGSPCSATISGV
jgi:hypothetical protein